MGPHGSANTYMVTLVQQQDMMGRMLYAFGVHRMLVQETWEERYKTIGKLIA